MACTWIDYVLGEFPDEQPFARVTLLEDPDTLLADETIFAKLEERKYRVVEFSTPIALRFVYEPYVRPSSDSRLIVIFRNGEDIDELVPGMTFEQNAILGINGVMYRAVRQTTDFPVVLLVESGHIVYDEDEEGRKALVVDDYTLSEDWEIWSDAGIPRTLEQMTDDQEDFMAQEQADMAAFKQEIRNDAAQLIVLAAASLKPGTKITSSSGTEYTAEALLTAVADLMESTIVVNDEDESSE